MPRLQIWEASQLPSRPEVEIVTLGDVCPARSFERRFLESPLLEVVDPELLETFARADAVIANLEAVLTTAETWRIPGVGLRAHPEIATILRQIGITHVTLANNHMRDLLDAGVLDTLRYCQNVGLETIGAGANIEEASRVWQGKIGGISTSLIAVAEREFNIAGISHAGTALFNPSELPSQVSSLRHKTDLTLVSIHAGHEFFLSPSPRQIATYRAVAAAGATAVIGHHPHVLNGWETWENNPIFYSLGNFCFDSDYVCSYPHWEIGLALVFYANPQGLTKIEGIPFRIKRGHSIRTLQGENFLEFQHWWKELNAVLTNEEAWRANWRKNCLHRFESESRRQFVQEALKLDEKIDISTALRWFNRFQCPTSLEYYQEIFLALAEKAEYLCR